METREGGLEAAIRAAGGVGVLARALGVPQPSVSDWRRIPAERVLAVESLTGVPRSTLRPDLYPADAPAEAARAVDEIDLLRAHEYALLAALLARAPDRDLLTRVAALKGDATLLGMAHVALAEAAASVEPDAISREYFDLFVGVSRGELLPYVSYYLTGFLLRAPAGPRPRGFPAARHRGRRGAQRTRGPHRDAVRGHGGIGRRPVRG